MTPVCMDLRPNLFSIVVITTFTKPFTTIPEDKTEAVLNLDTLETINHVAYYRYRKKGIAQKG